MTGRFRGGCAGGLTLLLVTACAAPQSTRIIDAPGELPPRAEVTTVPFFPQEAFFCGPAALAMSLNWSGLAETPDSVASRVYTPGRGGTLAADMVSAARRKGRLAVEVRGLDNLLAEIAAGHPVIVFQNLALEWWPQWHFAVVIGYDLTRREIVLHSGTTERLKTPLDAFERTWDRSGAWALVTLPPDHLPATADRQSLLLAAAGLEQAERNDAAATAYQAIAKRWPDDATAWIGQGNAWFALGQFRKAEGAFREAIARDAAMAPAWNNLAYTLSRRGRESQAIAAARVALEYAKGDKATYRDTLREVSGPNGPDSGAKGFNDPLVAPTQIALSKIGYDPGPIDGILGPKTRSAIRAYQSNHGLLVDGRLSPELLDHIRSAS